MLSTHNNIPAVVDTFSYPITINFTLLNDAGTFCTFSLIQAHFCTDIAKFLPSSTIPITASCFRVRSFWAPQSRKDKSREVSLLSLLRETSGMGQVTIRTSFSWRRDKKSSYKVVVRFSYIDGAGNTFNRRVDAAFNNITLDEQSGSLSPVPAKHLPPSTDASTFAGARLPSGVGKQGC